MAVVVTAGAAVSGGPGEGGAAGGDSTNVKVSTTKGVAAISGTSARTAV
jgi:hypothetical protein